MAEGIVLLPPEDIPDPPPFFQQDGHFASTGLISRVRHARLAELRRKARKQARRQKASERQRKRLRGLASCRATLALLRGEDPSDGRYCT